MSDSKAQPKYREFGRARLAAAKSAASDEDWGLVFKPGTPFPFQWGPFWKLYVQYRVADLPAEIGFFMDILGLEASIFCAEQVVLTSPDRDFHFSITPTPEGGQPTPPDSVALAFMIQELGATVTTLEARGVRFEEAQTSVAEGDPMSRAACRSPSGVRVELWEFTPPTT